MLRLFVAVLSGLLLFTAACSEPPPLPTATGTPTPVPPATPQPTPTPTSQPTATPRSTSTSRDFWNKDFWRETNVEEIRIALDEGWLDVESKNESGDTPFHYAAEFNTDPLVISLLLDHGAQINALGWSQTPLHLAAMENVLPVVAVLLDRGADIMARSKDSGYTPLHFAAGNEDVRILMLLLERGADPTAENGGGTTPLHIATQELGTEAAVKILLEAGADPAAMNQLRSACLFITADGVSEYLPGLCSATPVPRPSSVTTRTEAGQTSVCSRDVGWGAAAVRTEDAEALHNYVSDRQREGATDGSLQDRWLCIRGGVVREIASVYVLDRARGVDLSMETVLVPGSQATHVIRLTTYNPEETHREWRTTGILCLTDDVESLEIGEKITIFGRYYKARAYLDLAVDDSHIQKQVVRFCKWER